MNFIYQTDDRSLSEVLDNYSTVSGSSIVTSSDYELIVVRSASDLIGTFNPLSSVALCLMIIAAFFYKKVLDLIKSIFSAMLERRR